MEKRERDNKFNGSIDFSSNSVIREQKEHLRMEDSKVMQYMNQELQKKQREDETNKKKAEQQRQELKHYLDMQLEEKKYKKEQEQ